MQTLATATTRQFRPAPVVPHALLKHRDPLDGLSALDRERFHRFGWGPQVTPRFPTIISAIDHQMATRPKAVAAEHDGAWITYGELDAMANRLANVLHAQGVRAGDAVCLRVDLGAGLWLGGTACGGDCHGADGSRNQNSRTAYGSRDKSASASGNGCSASGSG